MIDNFRGEYKWLSNFWLVNIEFEGHTYISTEHAYQAGKTLDEAERQLIRDAKTCDKVRKIGQTLHITKDWDLGRKIDVMKAVIASKFNNSVDLQNKLISTNEQYLVEGNTWHDNYWGVCGCCSCKDIPSKNMLGMILMEIRAIFMEKNM